MLDTDFIKYMRKHNFLTVAYSIDGKNDIEIFQIDEKIKTYIKEDYNCNDDCKLGMKSINVGSDGNFYPCMQFVGKQEYINGIIKQILNQ